MALRSIRRLPPLLLVQLLLVSGTSLLVSGQGEDDDAPVLVKWGVADTVATVGHLFRLHIPSDAFSGPVLSYAVKTANGLELPDWLEFNDVDNVIQGIPSPRNAGQQFLEITAKGSGSKASVQSSVFVREVPSHTSGAPLKFHKSGPELVRCRREEPETVATLILDVDVDTLPASHRMALLHKFLSHMDLHEQMVKVLPIGSSPMHDSSALVSGTGDCAAPKTTGTFVSWPVGCGQVKEGHFPVLQLLDNDSGTGKMTQVLGHPVVGWHVTNSHIQAPKRKRRQAMATATAVMTPIVPTKTDTMGEKTTDDGGDKMTREVLDRESPTFIQPTATQPEMPKTDEPDTPPPKVEEEKTEKLTTTQPTTPETPAKVTPPIIPTSVSRVVDEPTDKPKLPQPKSPDVVVDPCVKGQKPEVSSKRFKKLMFNVGDVIDFVIPADVFEDCEVGGTRGLELMLFKGTTEAIPSDFFIQFDGKQQKIIGLPMNDDIGKYRMNLVAKKKSNALLNNFDFMLVIKGVKGKKKITHELSVTVDYDYDAFMSDVKTRTQLASNVASVYGDSDTSNLVITKQERGSVIYGWANKTMASDGGCPAAGISDLVGMLVNPDGTLTQNAIEKLKPFSLKSAAAVPAGACEGDPNFPAVVSKPLPEDTTDGPVDPGVSPSMGPDVTDAGPDKEDDTGEMVDTITGAVPPATKKPTVDDDDDDEDDTTDENTAKSSKDGEDEDDIWITTVVPAVVIVVILLVALLIACVLYRKKRKGKMNVEEQNTFVNKGTPVIFPDELEDKPSDVNKPLLVEGSPAPPPEYHRGTSESPEPELANNHRNNVHTAASTGPPPPASGNQHLHDDGDAIQELPERPYEPPAPPLTGSNNRQPRPAHHNQQQQQPYSQPPQILP